MQFCWRDSQPCVMGCALSRTFSLKCLQSGFCSCGGAEPGTSPLYRAMTAQPQQRAKTGTNSRYQPMHTTGRSRVPYRGKLKKQHGREVFSFLSLQYHCAFHLKLRAGVKFTSSKDIGKVDNSHGLNL